MVGTIHRLKTLEKPLENFLKEVSPKVITAEISPFSILYRRKRYHLWRTKIKKLRGKVPDEFLNLLATALSMPYEFYLPKKLGLCPVVPVDLCTLARKYLFQLEELLANPPSVWENTDSFAKELAFLRLFKEGLYFPPRDAEDMKRERFMARKIKKLALLKRPLVHIGGWRHLPGLLSFLPEAVPVCLNPFSSSWGDNPN